VLSGGLVFGAVFMATDYTTTPMTPWGKVIFGVGCGLVTSVIRIFCDLPGGVSYSILLMNLLTPYIEKLTMPKALGGVKE
jgi:electron transport complex protein RnfD